MGTVHEFCVRSNLLVLTQLGGFYAALVSENDSKALALVGELPKGLPVFDVSGREDSVAHFRLMLLGLIAIAKAPTRRTNIFRVVVSVVINQHTTELLNLLLVSEEDMSLLGLVG